MDVLRTKPLLLSLILCMCLCSDDHNSSQELMATNLVPSSDAEDANEPIDGKWETWQCNDDIFKEYPSFEYNCDEGTFRYFSCAKPCEEYPNRQCDDTYCVKYQKRYRVGLATKIPSSQLTPSSSRSHSTVLPTTAPSLVSNAVRQSTSSTYNDDNIHVCECEKKCKDFLEATKQPTFGLVVYIAVMITILAVLMGLDFALKLIKGRKMPKEYVPIPASIEAGQVNKIQVGHGSGLPHNAPAPATLTDVQQPALASLQQVSPNSTPQPPPKPKLIDFATQTDIVGVLAEIPAGAGQTETKPSGNNDLLAAAMLAKGVEKGAVYYKPKAKDVENLRESFTQLASDTEDDMSHNEEEADDSVLDTDNTRLLPQTYDEAKRLGKEMRRQRSRNSASTSEVTLLVQIKESKQE